MTINDIVARIYQLSKTNSQSYPAADMLIDINNAYNRVVSIISRSDSRWQFDDSNNTDLPIATTNIVSGQQDYSLLTSHLTIDRARLQDSAGNWHLLKPRDIHDQRSDVSINRFNSSGIPSEYDKSGVTIFLGPIPNYSKNSALEIRFTRGPAEYSSGDVSTGTKQPGFNSLYHELIPLWVAYDYVLINLPELATGYMNKIQILEADLENFYGLRSRDERVGFRVNKQDSNK